jgi:hypothetical protein
MRRSARVSMTAVVAAAVAAGAFGLGRATAPADSPPPAGTAVGDHLHGLRVGEAQGRLAGRAEQEAVALADGDRAPVQDAFTAGYASGTNDVSAGYDGGWTLDVPWIVTLERGAGPITYRIASRTPVEPGVDPRLCPDVHTLCQRPR